MNDMSIAGVYLVYVRVDVEMHETSSLRRPPQTQFDVLGCGLRRRQ